MQLHCTYTRAWCPPWHPYHVGRDFWTNSPHYNGNFLLLLHPPSTIQEAHYIYIYNHCQWHGVFIVTMWNTTSWVNHLLGYKFWNFPQVLALQGVLEEPGLIFSCAGNVGERSRESYGCDLGVSQAISTIHFHDEEGSGRAIVNNLSWGCGNKRDNLSCS